MKSEGSLNIAMFGHKRFPSREGGVEVVVEELAVRMSSAGHRLTCYNRSGHHVSGSAFDDKKRKSYEGVRIKRLPTIEAQGAAAASSSFFGALFTAFGKYDVVHIHAEGPAFMCLLPHIFGKRVIVTVHGLDHQRAKWGGFAKKFIMLGEKNAVRYADEIIVLSRGVQDYFKQKYGRNTVFIPNGTSRGKYAEADLITQKWGLEKDGYILYLGRIVPEKGIHRLIKAFGGTDTDKKLVIAGGSSDTDEYMKTLKTLAENDGRVIFTDFVEGRTLRELYSNAYVYTLPSDLEGMPLSLLEAMSFGNCCLISDIPECADVAEDKAVTFRHGDESDLEEKLRMLCASPELVRKYKEQAADYICGKYSWDKTAEKTLLLYKGRLHE